MRLFIKFADLLFYGNSWIALGATAMALQTQLLLNGKFALTPVVLLVFFATLFLYSIHRIVGLEKVRSFADKGRYKVITKFKNHILFYAVIGAVGGIIFFFKTSLRIQLALLIPALISFGYVIPFLSKERRLRDLGYFKIFLIALVWAWVTVILPALELHSSLQMSTVLMAIERALFIFVITLPFDIRDLKVDAFTDVKTIPAKIGIPKTKLLAAISLALMLLMIYLNFHLGTYDLGTLLALSLSIFSTYLFIHFSDRMEHDYYFTGLMDGTMLLQFGLVWFFYF